MFQPSVSGVANGQADSQVLINAVHSVPVTDQMIPREIIELVN